MSMLVMTGTGTGVGKTISTAAIAALAAGQGQRVAVLKPAQTGVGPDEPGDLADVTRLAGPVTTRELLRYPDPLSPEAAARLSGLPTLSPSEIAAAASELDGDHDLTLIEGAGGLLVRFDADGATLADVAWSLGALVIIVAEAGLGTLNATALTAEVATKRGLTVAGVIVGAWPDEPDLAAVSNLEDLPVAAGAPLLGVLPAGMGTAEPAEFTALAKAGLSPWFGGEFDPERFAGRASAQK
ncbi:dethiobiotin synthetase [Amycolatopsis regifaucium]|uniref:ATP-dependent dethiobiotin synthetase BioD n=2 Tax=Amycolatopsis regifaucium TaxID=546365 RepID=A0A154MNS3_9PSEU|nr:dethiobiotin synthase [Amycolatopsis regifaucium]KZB85643.1 dethiobiotin synthetase [Amycolatopsis regifaucium]OKA10604.1 dethiobiotin synthase [Amycolatopsis regifaucium]